MEYLVFDEDGGSSDSFKGPKIPRDTVLYSVSGQ